MCCNDWAISPFYFKDSFKSSVLNVILWRDYSMWPIRSCCLFNRTTLISMPCINTLISMPCKNQASCGVFFKIMWGIVIVSYVRSHLPRYLRLLYTERHQAFHNHTLCNQMATRSIVSKGCMLPLEHCVHYNKNSSHVSQFVGASVTDTHEYQSTHAIKTVGGKMNLPWSNDYKIDLVELIYNQWT